MSDEFEKVVLKSVYESGIHQDNPKVLKVSWKDGIDVNLPSLYLMNFARKLIGNSFNVDILTANILREWDRDKIVRFATHLFGSGSEIVTLREENNRLSAALRLIAKDKIGYGHMGQGQPTNVAIIASEVLTDNEG